MTERYIEQRLEHLRERISNAAQSAGRGEVTLLAAVKNQDAGTVRKIISLGVRDVGENKAQEMRVKLSAYEGARLHFLGRLQRNKVRTVVGNVDVVQSLDSVRLAAEIERVASELGIVQDCLIEINGGESAKGGIDRQELPAFIESVSGFAHIRIRGAMAMAPLGLSKAGLEKFFSQIHEVYIDIREKIPHNIDVNLLSMGMSGDFETAIRCGSNMVRLGTALFGS